MSSSNRSSQSACQSTNLRRRAAGSTLVEVLITLAIMSLVMGGVLAALAMVSSAVGDSRAMIEMTDRLRSCQVRLRQDLAGMTAPGLPPLRPDAGQGYLEIIEGPIRDSDYAPDPAPTAQGYNTPKDHTKGDADDIIMFTVRSQSDPFQGRFGGQTIESNVAEVVWFTAYDPPQPIDMASSTTKVVRPFLTTTPPLYLTGTTLLPWNVSTAAQMPMLKLCRRVFLVRPELGVIGEQQFDSTGTAIAGTLRGLSPDQHDVSVRVVATGAPVGGVTTIQWIANSLGDLTKPQCRTGHAGNLNPPFVSANGDPVPVPTINPVAFPMAISPTISANTVVPKDRLLAFADLRTGGLVDPASRYGEDVVLSNVLAFDIKVWDPMAPVFVTSATDESRDRAPKVLKAGTALVPGDPGYERCLEITLMSPSRTPFCDARGAYVDLNYTYYPNNTGATASNLFTNNNRGRLAAYSAFSGPGDPVDVVHSLTTPHLARLIPLATSTTVPSTAVYDTWSMHYEYAGARVADTDNGGVNRDGQGTNGVDDPPAQLTAVGVRLPADGVVDDPGERVTSPPYPAPLRGIQIKIRVFEPESRTVREVTVVESLLQE